MRNDPLTVWHVDHADQHPLATRLASAELTFEELLPYVLDAMGETPGAVGTVRRWWARHFTRAVPQVRADRRRGRVAIAGRLEAPATGSRTS